MNAETKKLVCRMVGGLLASDEDFDDAERAFVDRLLAKFGIPDNEWDAIFPLMEAHEAEEALKALEPATREEVFETLLAAAGSDQQVSPEEEEYLQTVGRALGLSEKGLSERLDAIAYG